MKRRLLIVLAFVVIGLGWVGYYLYGGSTVPNGQQALVRLTDSNFASLKSSRQTLIKMKAKRGRGNA